MKRAMLKSDCDLLKNLNGINEMEELVCRTLVEGPGDFFMRKSGKWKNLV